MLLVELNMRINQSTTYLQLRSNNADLRNNAGGYYNHSYTNQWLQTQVVSPPILVSASWDFWSYEDFTVAFKAEARKHLFQLSLISDKSGS
jgi:Fe-Mn family superoxide dismutase